MNDRTKVRAVPSGTRIRAYLERNGWTRETAGDKELRGRGGEARPTRISRAPPT